MSCRLIIVMSAVLLASACRNDAPAPKPVADKPAVTTPAAPAPGTPAAPTEATKPAPAAAFSIDSVAVSAASLGAFPYFSLPDGVSTDEQKGQNFDFDRRYFQTGDDFSVVEGKVSQRMFQLAQAGKTYTELEIHRNYENLIIQAGGVKTHGTQMTQAMIDQFGGREKLEKGYFGPGPGPDYEHNTYVIRQPNREIWVQVATGAVPAHGYVLVVERAAMAQSVTLLKADQLKKEIDAKGRVAVYINFDTDKADIKSESLPAVDEIAKLLQGNGALKLSVEGHTDNTGTAARNLALSGERAQSVVAALTGKGIAKERLSAKGLGQDKPLADNISDAVRAKNRRVELVKAGS